MNDLTNHGVPRAFQLLWRRRPRVAAASWCKRRYGREREWRSRVGLTECGSSTSVDTFSSQPLGNITPYSAPLFRLYTLVSAAHYIDQNAINCKRPWCLVNAE